MKMLTLGRLLCLAAGISLVSSGLFAQPPEPKREPLLRAVDLNIGESAQVTLCDGSPATVKLVDLKETRGILRDAVRTAVVTVEVNGETVKLTSATYHLPQTVAGVRIDCPITKGYRSNANRKGIWGLKKDARLRLWPKGSPVIAPGTFQYPARQKWFASDTQMANEPVYVDGGEIPKRRSIYYHYGLDIGGAEGMVEIVAATDGLVVSAGEKVLPGYQDTPVSPRYDVVYLLDDRGWLYRYSHLKSIDEKIRPGQVVKIGQKVGVLGKEGGSGGWSHLHFDINARQPSGEWGIQEGYAFLLESYVREFEPQVIAVARPHHFGFTGQEITLNATRSWSAAGGKLRYEWTLGDGKTSMEAKVRRRYEQPGTYSEILKVTDAKGNVDYDFAVVQIVDREHPDRLPPSIHAVFAPSFNLKPGDPVTFKVRSFRTSPAGETWNFGDGSPPVQVKSDANARQHAKDGYAVTTHKFAKPGDYIVRVEHTGEHGKAVGHVHVRVRK